MKNEENNINSILSRFLKENKLNEGFLAKQAIDAWHTILGNKIKNYTDEVFVKNKILFVKINSPIMRKELECRKSETLHDISLKIKSDFIINIIYV